MAKKMKHVLLMALSLVLVAALAISGTVAYLTSEDSDVNVMTLGNVKIRQHEYQRAENVEHNATASKAAKTLVPFVQGQALYPAVPTGENPYTAMMAKEDCFKWGDYITAEGAWNGLWDDAKLGNVMDKMVFVENTGKSDAYVRTIIAFECPDGMKVGDAGNGDEIGINTNSIWKETGIGTIEVSGVNYYVYEYVYTRDNGVLPAGATSRPSLLQVVMNHELGNEDVAKFGDTYEILVVSQAVQTAGFADAETALDTAFGNITTANHPWMTTAVEIPSDAMQVASYEELQTALENGGNIALKGDIEANASVDVSKDTVLYAENGAVLSFAPAAQMKVKNGATLELKGVKVDNGDTFGFGSDGKLGIDDLEGRKTNAAFDVAAGSTIIVGEGTEISNIVSKDNAVIHANGAADNRATVIVKGTITDCAGKSGTIINANANADVYIEDGTIIRGNVSYDNNNHGIIRVYSGSVVYINGGEITDNIYSGNGMIGIYHASVVMNGGMIYNNTYCARENSWIDSTSTSNGRYGLIYVHNNSLFTMNGGAIFANTVGSDWGAIDTVRGAGAKKPSVVINGGQITGNYYENTEAFGSTDSRDHIIIAKDAVVSGTLYDHEFDQFADVNTYKKV